jgi:hypothetical protein
MGLSRAPHTLGGSSGALEASREKSTAALALYFPRPSHLRRIDITCRIGAHVRELGRGRRGSHFAAATSSKRQGGAFATNQQSFSAAVLNFRPLACFQASAQILRPSHGMGKNHRATSPAFAQEVGTAAAVNPESQGTPPGGTTTTLKVGARVVHKERIKTTPQGSVQLLFLDRSTLSIAPNSEIVIDEFVYNPGAGSGHMAVSLAKGALRLVGGQLSHQGEASVTTPGATIGIRGGTSIITLTEAININGLLTLGNGCPPVKRPGFKIILPCGPIAQATPSELAYFIRLFGGTLGGNGGVAHGVLRGQTTRRRPGPILTMSSSKGRSTAREPVRRHLRHLRLRRHLRCLPRPTGAAVSEQGRAEIARLYLSDARRRRGRGDTAARFFAALQRDN